MNKKGKKFIFPSSFILSTLLSSPAQFYSFSLSGRLRRAVGLIALTMCHNSLYTINWQLRVWRGYGINRLINELYLLSCTILWRFFVLTRKTLNLNVSLPLQFEASLCYFWSLNLIATKEPFFFYCIGGDVYSCANFYYVYDVGMSSIHWLMSSCFSWQLFGVFVYNAENWDPYCLSNPTFWGLLVLHVSFCKLVCHSVENCSFLILLALVALIFGVILFHLRIWRRCGLQLIA